MAAVANPEPIHDFDGKIFLKRVSETKQYAKKTYTSMYHDHVAMNEEIKRSWRSTITSQMNAQDAIQAIVNEYGLELTAAKLHLRYYKTAARGPYHTLAANEVIGACKIRDVTRGIAREVTVEDLQLQVLREAGESFESDLTCDSEFMKIWMPRVGEAMRASYHWVPITTPLHLIMDNAGGHGRIDVIAGYKALLKEQYNVVIIHQIPRGPEMNLLDLGCWVSLQSAVEKHHRKIRTEKEALARTIEEVWETFDGSVFQKVYERWLKVLDLIISDNGDNRLVDSHRGELLVALVLPKPAGYDDDAAADDDAADDDDDGVDTF